MNQTRIKLYHFLLIELFILCVVLGIGFAQRRTAVEVPVDLGAFQANDAYSYDGSAWTISEDQLDAKGFLVGADADNGNKIHLTSPKMRIPKGDYTLVIQFDDSVNQEVELLCGKTYWRLLRAESYFLSKNQTSSMYHFQALDDIPDFQIQLKYNNYGVVRISNISIVPNANGLKRGVLAVVLLSLLVNYLFLHREWIRTHRTRLMIMGAVAFMLSAPLFAYGISGGHDLIFHLVRIEGIAEGLRNHQFPVRMDPIWLDGYGYPVSVYYGDILLYIPAIFRLFGYSVITSFKIFMVLVNFATVWSAYKCFRGIFKDYKIAVVSAVAYSIAPYRFSCLYQRQALGEYCAMIFFPLVALGMYRIYTATKNTKKIIHEETVILAFGMLGILLTHILSFEITVFVLVLLAVVFIKRTFSKPVIQSLIQAVVLTCLLGAFFLVPFLDYYLNVAAQINSDVQDGAGALIQWRAVYIADLFNVFSNPFGWDDEFLYNRIAMTPGLMLMIAFVLAIGFILKGKASKETKIFTAWSTFLLWMTTDLFPWDFIALHIWRGVSIIQFSCRFLGPACLFLSLTLGSVLVQMKELPRGKELLDMEPEEAAWTQMQGRVENRRNRMAVTWFLVCGALSLFVYLQYYSEYDFVLNFQDTAELDNSAVTSFFLREDTEEGPVTKGLMQNTNILSYEKVLDEGIKKEFQVTVGEGGGTLELPIFNYKGWQVQDDDGVYYALSDGTQDLISVDLPSGFSGRLYATFCVPWYWRLSELVSILAVIVTFGAIYWQRNYQL
ncbi:hypothetical protein SAMN02910301_0371 [Lachnospiraceae bacterium XBD2001]|nr:hypothetical protein SAMN02910301_0371 [Lachnospiraceae bacterium XBD2001]